MRADVSSAKIADWLIGISLQMATEGGFGKGGKSSPTFGEIQSHSVGEIQSHSVVFRDAENSPPYADRNFRTFLHHLTLFCTFPFFPACARMPPKHNDNSQNRDTMWFVIVKRTHEYSCIFGLAPGRKIRLVQFLHQYFSTKIATFSHHQNGRNFLHRMAIKLFPHQILCKNRNVSRTFCTHFFCIFGHLAFSHFCHTFSQCADSGIPAF